MPRLLVVVPAGASPRLSRGAGYAVVREEHVVKCHCVAEVEAAADADFLTISPVAPTLSKPGYGPPLGVAGVRAAVEAAGPVPVFALGGVTAKNARSFREAGAYGVAVMGAVLRADDPRAVVAELVAVL
jgi:thiamine-phosphate pyrophosphorylase